MRELAQSFSVIFIAFLFAPAALARVQISIDLSAQRMEVQASNGESYSWPISSARAGYVTPRGVFAPTSCRPCIIRKNIIIRRCRIRFSSMAAMPFTALMRRRSLGRPASHGCVRISPANAATLYSLVRAEGATIRISGSPPPQPPFAERRAPSPALRRRLAASRPQSWLCIHPGRLSPARAVLCAGSA